MKVPLNLEHTRLVKNLIRYPFAFPGGYERFAVTHDGEAICYQCVRKEFKTILHSTLFRYRDGWQIEGIGLCCDSDDMIECTHCNRIIREDWKDEK